MTENNPSTTTRLLNFFSRRPIRFSRFFERILAGLINNFHIGKTAKVVRLNVDICLPYLSTEHKNQIARAAISHELQSYMEFDVC